jgi:orotidine-5'-phosphate decarboxylase
MSSATTFTQRLAGAWQAHDSMLCVGLDPDLRRLPAAVLREADPIFTFLREIVDASAPFCAAFKPQIAYFAAVGAERSLERLMTYIATHHPAHLRLLDAKRGDIGDTAAMYAREAFVRYVADAVTVSPYLGPEGVAPFVADPARGCFLLCRTSNPDSDVMQLHGSPPLYQRVATLAAGEWNGNGNLGLVAGATQPAALADIRRLASDLPLLVPGVGAQGGDVEAAVRAGRDSQGRGMLINSSRAILYASAADDFPEAAAAVARQTHQAIQAAARGG